MATATAACQEPEFETTKLASDPRPKSATTINLDLILRILLLATTVVAVVVMVISKETKVIAFSLTLDAKFNYSPALM